MLYLGADHRGFQLKEELKKWLEEKNIPYEDMGNKVLDPNDDDVDYSIAVAQKVTSNKENKGIVVCGSGAGMSVAANKTRGIRCAVAINKELVQQDRGHDDINMISLPAQALSLNQVQEIVEVFLNTSFSGLEKYQRRLKKISALEK